MTSDIAGLVVRLRHAMTTMANDDYSEVGSDKRKRHVARLDAMDKSATALEAIGRERDEARRQWGNYEAAAGDLNAEVERLREGLRVIATMTVAEVGEPYAALLLLIDAARETAALSLQQEDVSK